MFVGEAPGGAGLNPEVSDPTTGPDDEKCVIDCGVDGGLIPWVSDPTTGPDDEKGVIV